MRTADLLAAGRLLLALVVSTPALAASARVITPDEAPFENEPVTIRLVVRDAVDVPPPEFPQLPDADVRYLDRVVQQFTFNQQTTRLVTFVYQLTPRKPGTLTIPPISLAADDSAVMTAPVTIRVLPSPLADPDDILTVNVATPRPHVFVGERVPLTLRATVKPPEAFGLYMSYQDLAGQFDYARSRLDPFTTFERAYAAPQKDADAAPRYVFETSTNYLADAAGPRDFSQLRLVIDYPVQLKAVRRQLLAQRSVRLVAAPSETLTVKPLPTAGRPPSFNGAVGVYQLEAHTDARDVRVGDPIPVDLVVRGAGPLEVLAPPRLEEQPALTRNFRVVIDDPGGVVTGSRKTFSLTLRAKHAAVEAIPPIDFAYFDPYAEAYAVARSAPLPLDVTDNGAESLAVTGLAAARLGNGLAPRPDVLRSNRADADQLLARTWTPTPTHALLAILLGPACFALIFAATTLSPRRTASGPPASAARRRLRTALQTAARQPAPTAASLLGSTFQDYLATRLDLPQRPAAPEAWRPALIAASVPRPTADACVTWLEHCERTAFGATPTPTDELIAAGRQCLDDLDRTLKNPRT